MEPVQGYEVAPVDLVRNKTNKNIKISMVHATKSSMAPRFKEVIEKMEVKTPGRTWMGLPRPLVKIT